MFKLGDSKLIHTLKRNEFFGLSFILILYLEQEICVLLKKAQNLMHLNHWMSKLYINYDIIYIRTTLLILKV